MFFCKKKMLPKSIIEKYNISTPRYTSYPTILDWNQKEIIKVELKDKLKSSFNSDNSPTSVYIHLPFCEQMCTFCGCHKYITKNHSVEEPYIDSLIREWEMYEDLAAGEISVAELHLGGGTPTFFSADELKRLINRITKKRPEKVSYSFEGHPNYTTPEQLQTLFDLGFSRVSFGVQDYDPIVQKAINRVQPLEKVKYVTELARKIGYKSISHDLVFGLPFQKMESMKISIQNTLNLKPDNISLYSYAHVPWVKGTGQRGFSDEDLPSGSEKRKLYEYAKSELLEKGYLEIGMDHFGLPSEPMTKAMLNKKLKRNFMGYTTSNTNRLIGIGASAISEHDFGFVQNEKNIKLYQELVSNDDLPAFKGHYHSKEDKILKKHIHELMCGLETDINNQLIKSKINDKATIFETFKEDGIIEMCDGKLRVTKQGKPFVRNVCMTIDPYNEKQKEKKFSKSV